MTTSEPQSHFTPSIDVLEEQKLCSSPNNGVESELMGAKLLRCWRKALGELTH